MKRARITEIMSQDGSCLAEFMLEKGDVANDTKHRASAINEQRNCHICRNPPVENQRILSHYRQRSGYAFRWYLDHQVLIQG